MHPVLHDHPSVGRPLRVLIPQANSSTLFPYTTLFRSIGIAVKTAPTAWFPSVVIAQSPAPERSPLQPENWKPDRKSTRLNSSLRCSSYAVLFLKKNTRAFAASARDTPAAARPSSYAGT